MKLILTNILLMLTLSLCAQTTLSTDDLKVIVGEWEGNLTYLDYQTQEPYSMPANLVVKEGKDAYQLILNNIYPKEPKANNTEKIKLDKSGLMINNQEITLIEELRDGYIRVQTEHEGKDDGKNAKIRYTYSFSSGSFLISKEVQFDASTEWIKRNEYIYHRLL